MRLGFALPLDSGEVPALPRDGRFQLQTNVGGFLGGVAAKFLLRWKQSWSGEDQSAAVRSGSAPSYNFDRPTDITIKHCTIYGAIRVMGMAHNGQGIAGDTREVIRESSHQPGHTSRARQAAPTRLTFDDIDVVADHRTPFYLAPGVT